MLAKAVESGFHFRQTLFFGSAEASELGLATRPADGQVSPGDRFGLIRPRRHQAGEVDGEPRPGAGPGSRLLTHIHAGHTSGVSVDDEHVPTGKGFVGRRNVGLGHPQFGKADAAIESL